METYALSDQGLKRDENQDRYFVGKCADQGLLLAVADGMGGEAGGGLAAQRAIEAVQEAAAADWADPETSLKKLFLTAERRIEDETRQDPGLQGMGTTLTAAFVKNGRTYWAHVGDSRLYLFRDGRLTQITEDQTFVTMLMKDGVITSEEARVHPMQNVLLYCLGSGQPEMDSGDFPIFKDDMLLLCTDGLYHEVGEEEMSSSLTGGACIKEKFEGLLLAALKAGGRDNITIAGFHSDS